MKNYKGCIATVLVIFVFVSSSAISAESYARFYGYFQTEKNLKERLFLPSSTFALSQYLGSAELGNLLGVPSGNGLDPGFRNGLPNGTNMSLWRVVMSGIATDFSKICSDSYGRASELDPQILVDFKTLCKWPSYESRNLEALKNIWIDIMGYQAPSTEFEAWANFFMSEEYLVLPPAEAVNQLSYSILLNPYFLLRN